MLARETNRHHGTPTPLDDDTIKLLATVAEHEGARLQLLTTKDDITRAATILAAADRTRYLTPRLHTDMIAELRWPGDPNPGADSRAGARRDREEGGAVADADEQGRLGVGRGAGDDHRR